MRKAPVFLALILSALAVPALAQPATGGGTVVASEAGKVAAVSAVAVSAQVVAIDPVARVVTLKTKKGKVVDVVAGDEVRNFDQIKLGDFVVVRYVEALTLELMKTKSGIREMTETSDSARAQPGERPAAAAGRQVRVIADVTAVNKKAKTITLKGPKGNSVTLDVKNPDHFKVVKVGDQVEAVYTEAVAISVEPAPAGSGKKNKK